MRCTIGTAALGILIAGCSSAPPDPRGVARDEVLVQVSASGRTDTRPDEARFAAGVQTIAATAAEASTGNSRAMNRVVAALGQIGIKPDDIRTEAITLSRIDYGANRGRFEANNRVASIGTSCSVCRSISRHGPDCAFGPSGSRVSRSSRQPISGTRHSACA